MILIEYIKIYYNYRMTKQMIIILVYLNVLKYINYIIILSIPSQTLIKYTQYQQHI